MSQERPPDVGYQTRILRQERGLSMRGLAAMCDLSPNTISLIERGQSSPSVSTLHQLATALKVPITAFFEQPPEPAEVILSRAGERKQLTSDDALLESLGSGLEGQVMEPFVVQLPPGADSGRQGISHPGHELVYCTDGELEYEVDGQRYQLEQGDALLFTALKTHRWRNPGFLPATFLLIIETAGQDGAAAGHLQP